jgi:hypothetical protein
VEQRGNKLKRTLLLITILLASVTLVFADFGMVLSEGFLIENNDETNYASKTTVAPWLSLPFGESDFFVSAGISVHYEDKFSFVPELFRLELTLRPGARFNARLGRIPWQDPSLFTAFGNLDGADISFNFGAIRLGAAGFYTGLLNKNTANINISPGDPTDYSADFDWSDFGNTYFAPRRILASLYGDFPGFPYGRGNIYAGLLAQFDLSEAEERYNTQYLLLRYTFYYKRFDLAAAGAMELVNTKDDGFKLGYAFSMEAGLQTGFLRDRLSLGLRYASGSEQDTAAFFPVIRESMGAVLTPVFSGMMTIRGIYQVRFTQTIAAYLGGRYFIRTDTSSFTDPYIANDSRLLGAEADGTFQWNPFSDFSFSVAGGIYFPKTGPAMSSDAPLRWSLKLNAIISF